MRDPVAAIRMRAFFVVVSLVALLLGPGEVRSQEACATGCDDGDVCTVDICTQTNTCEHQPIPGCCRSDADCGVGGRCVMACAGCFLHEWPCCRGDLQANPLASRCLNVVANQAVKAKTRLEVSCTSGVTPGKKQICGVAAFAMPTQATTESSVLDATAPVPCPVDAVAVSDRVQRHLRNGRARPNLKLNKYGRQLLGKAGKLDAVVCALVSGGGIPETPLQQTVTLLAPRSSTSRRP
jgi:hypothetical protein